MATINSQTLTKGGRYEKDFYFISFANISWIDIRDNSNKPTITEQAEVSVIQMISMLHLQVILSKLILI